MADAADLKSASLTGVWVRPPPALYYEMHKAVRVGQADWSISLLSGVTSNKQNPWMTLVDADSLAEYLTPT